MSATRVYKLAPILSDGTPRLVEASSESQVYRHAARKEWVVSIATQTDLIDLVGEKGVKLEKAISE